MGFNICLSIKLQAQGQIQAQPGQTAQVALAKPPVVSAMVSSGGVTTLPVTMAGISVSINQPHKAAGKMAEYPLTPYHGWRQWIIFLLWDNPQ